jgi:hypothetical protein
MSKKPIAAFAADIHWMTRTPEYRRETCPFNEVIGAKLVKFAGYLRKHGIPGFVAGDTFDISRSFNDWWTLRDVLREHFWPHVRLYVVPGQHDRFHHNANDRMTSLNALFDEAGPSMRNFSGSTYELDKAVSVYGAGWGDVIPQPSHDTKLSVLVTHKTLWHNTPVFPGQTEGNVAVEAAKYKALGYDMVFSGDNHKAFDVTVGGVEFHNIGCFTRSDVRYKEQQPRFCVLFDDMSVENVFVGEKDVFELERSDADKGREDKKDEFSEALAGGFQYGDTFKAGLERIEKEGKCGELVFTENQRRLLRDIINSI